MAGTITRMPANICRGAPAWNQPQVRAGVAGMALFATREGTLLGLYRSATEKCPPRFYLLASKNNGKNFQGFAGASVGINACPNEQYVVHRKRRETLATWKPAARSSMEKCLALRCRISQPRPATQVRKHSRLAVNGRGDTLLVWTEGTGWQRGGIARLADVRRPWHALGDKGSAPGVPTGVSLPPQAGRMGPLSSFTDVLAARPSARSRPRASCRRRACINHHAVPHL